MAPLAREKSLVVIQLSGGNDYLNTIVPYDNGIYYDSRTTVRIEPDEVLPIDDRLGFTPSMALTVVRVLALIAMLMPMNPASAEPTAPATYAIAVEGNERSLPTLSVIS